MPLSPVFPTDFAPLRLRKDEDRRLRSGHLWVYSNEVDVEATPLRHFAPGQPVTIQSSNGKAIGTGYVNPNTLLCARLVSRDPDHPLSPSLLVHRLNVALSLRERLYNQPFYRLVYGEGDGLPGLIVDRYGDLCVAQITTAGMDRFKDDILAALQKILKPAAVLWRNDGVMRELEGLERYVADAAGTVPETVAIEEDGLRFQIAPKTGQKTGWFYDQRILPGSGCWMYSVIPGLGEFGRRCAVLVKWSASTVPPPRWSRLRSMRRSTRSVTGCRFAQGMPSRYSRRYVRGANALI